MTTSRPILDDFDSAHLVIRTVADRRFVQDPNTRLSSDWVDAMTLAQQDGDEGVKDWLVAVEGRDRDLARRYRSALDAAEANSDAPDGGCSEPEEPARAAGPGPRPPRLAPGTRVKALDRGNFGEVVQDDGELITVHFVSPGGSENTVSFKRSQLRYPDGRPLDQGPAESAGPFVLNVLGTSEFIRADYRREWIVKKVLVKGRAGVIGGPQKAMKTSITIDLLVSLACGGRLFGTFEVPRPTKVLLISGESGAAVVQESCRRICRSKGIDPDTMDGHAYWGFDLPRLDSPDQLGGLASFIKANGIEVVILDPLYLCLLSGGQAIDPANLFDVGPLLKTITGTCLEAGATPLLVHHFRKNRENPNGPPELEDLSFAGVQEFARQWLLINRRERYEPGSGEHRLWFSVGGSDGHSGEWALDISEGVVDEDFRDREWRVTIDVASKAREQAKERAEDRAKTVKEGKRREADQRKVEASLRRESEATDKALKVLKRYKTGLTKRKWREQLGQSNDTLAKYIAILIDQGRIIESQVTTTDDNGRNHPGSGYLFVSDLVQENTRDNPGQSGTKPLFPNSGPGSDLPGTTGRDTPPFKGGVPPMSRVDCPDRASRNKNNNTDQSPGLVDQPRGVA